MPSSCAERPALTGMCVARHPHLPHGAQPVAALAVQQALLPGHDAGLLLAPLLPLGLQLLTTELLLAVRPLMAHPVQHVRKETR